MIRILTAFLLFALSIIMFEFPVNEFQIDPSLLSTKEVVSETVEKESSFSIDEDSINLSSEYKEAFAGINLISDQVINTIFYISYEILQPPR